MELPNPDEAVVIATDEHELRALAAAESNRVVTRRILKAPGAGVVRMTLAAGTTLAEHEAAVPLLIQAVAGTGELGVGTESTPLRPGCVIYLPATVRHSVRADDELHLLLTLLEGARAPRAERRTAGETAPVPAAEAGETATDADAELASAVAEGAATRRRIDVAECTCGEVNEPLPELDVRTVPHAIRHATVFGALDSLGPGSGLVLIASHDPLPLLAQIRQRTPDRFDVSYLQRGPQDWHLQFTRVDVATPAPPVGRP